ncbi:MAG TPA: hypothetical protein ENI38_03490, partial [Candidatus Acetothermia bacterium]|nr:hypothetical protein [Candidatus Acetothermia bacterium]
MKGAAWLFTLALGGLILWGSLGLFPRPSLPPWQDRTSYWGAANAVAAVVLGARLYDTLFEVLVFSMAMVGVRWALRPLPKKKWRPPVAESPLLERAADVLVPAIGVFGVYLAASGHLGPGGGFPAGAILGSGLLLVALAGGIGPLAREIPPPLLSRLEYGSLASLLILGGGSLVLGWRGGWL